MKIRIDGGVVVSWSGTSHELVLNGSVLIDGDTITSVGTDKSQPADKIIDASGKIVSPGFVNLHVHSQLNIGWISFPSMSRRTESLSQFPAALGINL